MKFEWTGLTLDELESSGKSLIIFGLGILVVYLTLSAQYESFALPFIILLAVPMAVLARWPVSLRGQANDVYCQIGLVMLIGLSARTRFSSSSLPSSCAAKAVPSPTRPPRPPVASAAHLDDFLRLHPRRLPLVFATGAGALGRRSVGTTIVGGMLLSTVLNLFFIPVLYVILSRLLRRGDAPPPDAPPSTST